MPPATMRRLLALGGVAGPVLFLAAWLVAGTMAPPDYSPVEDAISGLAAVDASTRWVMTAGLGAFTIGVLGYAFALRTWTSGPAWLAAAANAAATVGVAAFPLARSSRADDIHAAFALVAYVTIVLVPVLAAPPLAGAGYQAVARLSLAIAAAAALCLAGSLAGLASGLLQRFGLTLAHLWLAGSAAWLASGRAGTPFRDNGPPTKRLRRVHRKQRPPEARRGQVPWG